MVIYEKFPNPTVKQVIFQIRFPNLFYLENKIGDFQIRIMKEFPESSLIYRRQVLVTDIGPEIKTSEIVGDIEFEKGKKIWQFKSKKEFQLNVLTDSLDINSKHHKTYYNDGSDNFRDIIELVLSSFFEITKIPLITRIGLRYINECPIPTKDNETFRGYYNSVLPLDRFDISLSDVMNFKTITKINDFKFQYVESIVHKNNDYKLILDFDGFAENINSDDCMSVTDNLYEIIIAEFKKTVKKPVLAYIGTLKEE